MADENTSPDDLISELETAAAEFDPVEAAVFAAEARDELAAYREHQVASGIWRRSLEREGFERRPEFVVPERSAAPAASIGGSRPTLRSYKRASTEEAPAKLVVESPDADALRNGLALIRYRTENLQLAPVYGLAALAISPRVGHIHVTVDDGPWRWADATGQPVVVNGLPPGPHKIVIDPQLTLLCVTQ